MFQAQTKPPLFELVGWQHYWRQRVIRTNRKLQRYNVGVSSMRIGIQQLRGKSMSVQRRDLRTYKTLSRARWTAILFLACLNIIYFVLFLGPFFVYGIPW